MAGDWAGSVLGRLRTLLAGGRAEPVEPVAVRTLYVEEDFWGEVEVLPAANADWCQGEFDKIAAFADAHRAPGGAGWSDIYIREPPPVPLGDLHLPLSTVLDLLGARLSAFDRVTTGSFHAPEPVANVWGFGASPKMALVVSSDKDRTIVGSIVVIAHEDDGAARLMTALEALPSSASLMVVDWVRSELIRIQPSGRA